MKSNTEKERKIILIVLAIYAILFAINCFRVLPEISKNISNVIEFVMNLIIAVVIPIYFFYNNKHDNKALKGIFLGSEMIKVILLLPKFSFNLSNVIYLAAHIAFCIFILSAFMKEKNILLTKNILATITIILYFVHTVIFVINCVSHFETSLILNAVISVVNLIYIVLAVLYLKRKYVTK